MRALVQRVSTASVTVHGEQVSAIGAGLLVLLGVRHGDTDAEAAYLARKIAGLRVFADEAGKMNRSVRDVGGEVLVVSQFTLYGDLGSGYRPSFTQAAPPDAADALYTSFCAHLETQLGHPVARGVFRAHMHVALENDGPVTLMLERDPARPPALENAS